jgi:hypothetical protein
MLSYKHGIDVVTYILDRRYARVVDHLAIQNVAQGAPLGGGATNKT